MNDKDDCKYNCGLLSVIVPVYNVKSYLERCIMCLENQTYKNIEIILVDDYSTDGSAELCDEFRYKYTNIQVLHQTSNKGVSAARNCGLKKAKGLYITFMDPDDFIDVDLYEFLIDLIKQNNADISVCGNDDYYEGVVICNQKIFNDTVTPSEAVARTFKYRLWSSSMQIFTKKCINNIYYDEKISNGEDRLFLIKAFYKASKITYKTLPKYHYYHREQSAGTKIFSRKDLSLLKACEEIKIMVINNNPEFGKMADKNIDFAYMQLIRMMQKNTSERKELVNSLIKRVPLIIKNDFYSQIEKIRTIAKVLFIYNFSIYKIVENIYYMLVPRRKINRNDCKL